MASLVVPSTVQVRWIWQLSGADYAVNVLHYLISGPTPISQQEAAVYASAVSQAATDTLMFDGVSNAITLDRITVRDLREANLPEFEAPTNIPGAAAAVPLPLQAALVVTLRTAFAGRRFRGRCYLPGWSEAANTTGGTIDALYIQRSEAFMNEIRDVPQGVHGWALAVTSRLALLSQAVTLLQVRDNVWDTQRRRANPGI